MYKYSLVLALDSIKDLKANFNSHEVKMFKCPLQHPPVQCQHHHSQRVGAEPEHQRGIALWNEMQRFLFLFKNYNCSLFLT